MSHPNRWSRLWIRVILAVVVLIAVSLGVRSSSATPNGVLVKLIRTFEHSELFWIKPFSAHGVVAFCTSDGVHLWNTRTRTLTATLPKHSKILNAFFSADGNTFVTSSREKPVGLIARLWDTKTGRLKVTLNGLALFGPVEKSGVTNMITLTDDEELKFWNADTGELQKTVVSYKRSFDKSIISDDGRLVVRYGGRKAFLWEAARKYVVPWYVDLKAWDALFSPDSKIVATEDNLNTIQLWDTDTGRMRALLEGHGSTIYDITFSSDGRLLASASRDGTVILWDTETGRLLQRLPGGKEIARGVQFNPEGTVLAVGYHTQAKLWDLTSGRVTSDLERHRDVSTFVLFGTYRAGSG